MRDVRSKGPSSLKFYDSRQDFVTINALKTLISGLFCNYKNVNVQMKWLNCYLESVLMSFFFITNYQMCDDDYKFVVWVHSVDLPLAAFTLVPPVAVRRVDWHRTASCVAPNSDSRTFERAGNSVESEDVKVISCYIFDHLAEIINAMNIQDEKPLWAILPEGISWKRKELNRDWMNWKGID